MWSKISLVPLVLIVGGVLSHHVAQASPYQDSPFGFLDVPPTNFESYSDLGAHWLNGGREGYDWNRIESIRGRYDFSEHDQEICNFYKKGQNLKYTIRPINAIYGTRWVEGNLAATDEYPDGYLNNWAAFVQKFAERYDGDGIEDAPCLSKIAIRHYQLVHELAPIERSYWQNHRDQYAEVFAITYEAMKKGCGDCILYLPVPHISELNQGQNFLSDVLGYLKGKNLPDIGFDYHYWSIDLSKPPSENWKTRGEDYRTSIEYINRIEALASTYGFSGSNIISGESGMAGTLQMEPYQAGYVIRSYVANLANGQKKQFWTSVVEYSHYNDTSIFAHTGLIHNPKNSDGLSHKKLAYYAYKKMTEILEGSDWSAVQTVREAGDVYVYQFTRNGAPVYVAWWDYFNDPAYTPGKTMPVTITGLTGNTVLATEAVPPFSSGAEVTEYATAFRQQSLPVTNGTVTVQLGESPVFVEGPAVHLRVNGNSHVTVTASNPVTVAYTTRGGAGQEFFLVLNAPAMGIPLSYRNAAGQWVPLPANLADVTPFATAPGDGDYTLYTGTVPPGTYTLCLGYDTATNGHLDLSAAIYDCVTITVQ
jgi:hypothetical protein